MTPTPATQPDHEEGSTPAQSKPGITPKMNNQQTPQSMSEEDLSSDQSGQSAGAADAVETAPSPKTPDKLNPCPFCGGEAYRVDIEGGDDAGGSYITCRGCHASGNVEFGYKENFVSNWNRRSASVDGDVRDRVETAIANVATGYTEKALPSIRIGVTVSDLRALLASKGGGQ